MMLPNPVDHDTRSEGITRIGDRLGKFQTAAALLERLRRAFAKDRQKTMRNGLTEIFRGATNVDALDLRLGGVLNNVRKRIKKLGDLWKPLASERKRLQLEPYLK